MLLGTSHHHRKRVLTPTSHLKGIKVFWMANKINHESITEPFGNLLECIIKAHNMKQAYGVKLDINYFYNVSAF